MTQDIVLTAGVDVTSDRIEVEIVSWNHAGDSIDLIDLGLKTCLSCGAIQTADGSIPCGH
jgi:hypothetical protein